MVQFPTIKLFPAGDYLVFTRTREGHEDFEIMRLADGQLSGSIAQKQGAGVSDFWWVTPTRLVLAPSRETADGSLSTGSLVGINVDGSRLTYLFGPLGHHDPKTGTLIKHAETLHSANARVVALPADENKRITIAVDDWQPTELKASDHEAERAVHAYEYLPDNGGTHPMCGAATRVPCPIENYLYQIGFSALTRAFTINTENGNLASRLPGRTGFG